MLIFRIFQYSHPLIVAAITVVFAILLGLLIYWVLHLAFGWFSGYFQKTMSWTSYHKYWRKPLVISFFLVVLYVSQPFIVLTKKVADYYSRFLSAFTIFLITLLLIQVVYAIRDMIIDKNRGREEKSIFNARRLQTQIDILVKIIVILLTTIGAASALLAFPAIQKIGISILASAGIAGVLIGFAAQKSLGSLLGGIQIAFTQPIRIGDVVIVENEWGTIEEITLTYVVVCVWDQRRLIVPISYFLEKVFQNWTRNSSELIGIVYLETDYTVPVEAVRNALDNILKTTNLWDGRVKNVAVTEAKTQTIELRILVSATDSPTLWDLRCYVREKIIEFLQKEYPECLPVLRLKNKTAAENSSTEKT